MESSMSLSSLSFEEDEFYDSTDNEIRYVDIEKEILSKKTDDSGNIPNVTKLATTKENDQQKMLHIKNLGLRPKYPSEGKVYAIKSQDTKIIPNTLVTKTSPPPVKHYAYRTPKAISKQKTSPVVRQDHVKHNQSTEPKVKYFAIRTSINRNKLEEDILHSANESAESDNEQDAPEIPNLNSIEIIDESDNENNLPIAEHTDDVLDNDENKEPVSLLTPEIKIKTPQFAIRSNKSKSAVQNKAPVTPSTTPNSKPVATRTMQRPSKSKTTPFRAIAPKSTEKDQESPGTKKSVEEPTSEKPDNSLPNIDTPTVHSASTNSAEPIEKTGSVSSSGAPVTMPARSMVVHSNTPCLPHTNLPGMTSMTQSLNFVVPKEDIIKYKLNNTPLILSVPPLVSADGSQISPTTGRSLLMILPQQLPSNLHGPGVVNFLVTNPHFKPNVSVQIPTNAPPKMPSLTPLKNTSGSSTNKTLLTTQQKTKKASEIASSSEDARLLNTKEKDGPNWCWYVPKFGKRDLEGFLYKDRLGFSRTETEKARKCLRKLNIIVYKSQCELDDIASNIIKLKRGIKPAPSTSVMKPAALTEKPNILKRKRHITDEKSLPYTNENSSQTGSTYGTNQIKIVSVASLSEQNQDNSFLIREEQTDSPIMNIDDQSGDDCSSDLYYTKKVVILRNRNPNLPKRTRRGTRLPKIKLRQNKLAIQGTQKLKQLKPVLPPVKKCSVVLSRDEALEKEIRKKFDLIDRSTRKRKLDLESMGLIKKVRRRNAIDTPPYIEAPTISKIETKAVRSETNFTVGSEIKDRQIRSPVHTSPNLKIIPDKLTSLAHRHQKVTSNTCESKTEEHYIMINEDFDNDELASSSSSSFKITSEKAFDISTGHKKNAHDYKKSVFMSYRERQKISSLTHAERRFIFALNTIHSLEDLRLDDKKPLLVLDQHNIERDLVSVRFNFKFDFESMNNYNVVFTRDDDETLPLALLKNLKLVYLVRHGHIKVVSRPVLCKYLLEKCNLVKKPVEKMQMKETYLKNKDDTNVKKGKEVEKARPRIDTKYDTNKKHTVIIRHDLMPTKCPGKVISSNARDKQDKSHEVKTAMRSSMQILHKKRVNPKSDKEPHYLVKTSSKHKTDSLDTKFNEIEKNLSMMFEKAKPSTSDMSKAKQCAVPKDSLKNIFEDSIKDAEAANGVGVDLDYLFTNSGDENSDLGQGQKDEADTVPEGNKETDVNEKIEQSIFLEGNQASVVSKDHKDGTADKLEELLTSSVNQLDQVQEVVHRRQHADNFASVEFLEQKSIGDTNSEGPQTSSINENIELPKHGSGTSADDKNDQETETGHVTKQKDSINSKNEELIINMPISALEVDRTMTKVSCGSKCENANQVLVDVQDKQKEDTVLTDTVESVNKNEEIQSSTSKQENSKCLDIEQFLSKSGVESSNPTNENEFSHEKNFDDMSKRDIPLSHVSESQDVTKYSKENPLESEIGVHEQMDISENANNVNNIFTDTLSEQQTASAETDPIIPRDESLLYLIPEKSGDTVSIPADTSSDVNIGPLQISSSNMDDIEDASKMSYTVPSFETNEDLNEQVSENLINSSSEFELFNNSSDKVPGESTSITSRNLTFEDDTNDPESTMIMLETKKSTDADLLSSCEIDTDIAMCSDGISKNLPDDYLEK